MKGKDLYNYAKTLIPGGTMLLSKRPEMFIYFVACLFK